MVGRNVLLLEIRKDEPGREINTRVSIYRCEKCLNSHEEAEPPKFLPWAMSSYMLKSIRSGHHLSI